MADSIDVINKSEGVLGLLRTIRKDGWQNLITGMGTYARDKLQSTFFQVGFKLTDEELEALFHQDDMAARIVEAIPDEATRQGFFLTVFADGKIDAQETVQTSSDMGMACEEINALPKLNEAWTWGRLFGGGVVYLNTDDPGNPEEPLDPASVRKLISLMVLDKRDLCPRTWIKDTTHPEYGEPETYQVTRVGVVDTGVPLVIHHTRLIVFEGERTTRRKRMQNDGWSASVLERPNSVLRDFHTAWGSVAHLMTDSSQAVFKMEGLITMLASGGKDTLQERMQVVDMGRSVARALVIDAEKEEFERQESSLTGHADVLDKFMLRLAAAARMPVTKLMGQSPAGMNATGESDLVVWENEVKTHQERVLKPRLERLIKILFLSKEGPTKGVEPEQWAIHFKPLRQMTDKEKAELRKAVAETDKLYIDAGVVLPEEVTLSRFRPDGYSIETDANLELREASLEGDSGESRAVLNGAQVQALAQIILQVSQGQIPPETGIGLIVQAFRFSEEQARAIIGDAGSKPPAPAPAPPGAPPPAREGEEQEEEPPPSEEIPTKPGG